jgi:uncharacterized membrane protein YccC
VRMSTADREYMLQRLGKYLRQLGRLVFFLALAFYFQQLQQQWAVYLSAGCLLLSALTLFRKKA